MTATPAQRSMQARMAAHTLHARIADPAAHTRPAHDAFMARFEREVDPDGVLTTQERARRAEHARKAYFTALALKASQARSRKTAQNAQTRRAATRRASA